MTTGLGLVTLAIAAATVTFLLIIREIHLRALDARVSKAVLGLPGDAASSKDMRVAYFALLALMTLPVLFPIPRTADLVNHWARLTVLAMPVSDPLNAFYRVEWGVIPNLGIDLIYMLLASLLSVETIVRLAFILSFWLPAIGIWLLHRA